MTTTGRAHAEPPCLDGHDDEITPRDRSEQTRSRYGPR